VLVASALTSPTWSQCSSAALTGSGEPVDFEVVSLAPLVPLTYRTVGLNEVGEVAGWIFATESQPARAFVWRDGELKTRQVPGTSFSVNGINDGGVVVGSTFLESGAIRTFVWSSRNDKLVLLPVPTEVFPTAIGNRLRIVGSDAEGLAGFAYDVRQELLHTIAFGELPDQHVGTAGALGVNTGGVVVGAEVVFLEPQGFFQEMPYRWTDGGGIQPLPTLPKGFGGRAIAINEAGDIAGNVHDEFSGRQTALWTDGGQTLANLGSPPDFFVSDPTDINADRWITLFAPNDFFGFTRAFVWIEGSYVDLSCFVPAGLFAVRPLGVNDAGEILVELSNQQGLVILETVLLRPVRSPS
jgi:uncharacterized membrane protein